MNQIYQREYYKVYQCEYGYILHNSSMPGFAHTHLDSIKQAKLLIELSLKQKVPNDLSKYFLISLIRVNDNQSYCSKVNELISNKRKKIRYYNCSK